MIGPQHDEVDDYEDFGTSGQGAVSAENPLASLDKNVNTALKALDALEGVRVVAVSPSYYTEPQGLRDQAWFVNRVARLECDFTLKPHALLAKCLKIEDDMGRCRSEDPALRFGPRPIDIDILLFGQQVIDTPSLIVPHPRMHERAFVLVPLRDVWLDDVCPEKVCPKKVSLENACPDNVLSRSVTPQRQGLHENVTPQDFSAQGINDMLSQLPYRLKNSTIWQ